MCIVMIWYLTDVDEHSGGYTGSHRDSRNPPGPMTGSASRAHSGDLQVQARPVRSSCRTHAPGASTMQHRAKRVAVVNHWPVVACRRRLRPAVVRHGRPLTVSEYEARPWPPGLPAPLLPGRQAHCSSRFSTAHGPRQAQSLGLRATPDAARHCGRQRPRQCRHQKLSAGRSWACARRNRDNDCGCSERSSLASPRRSRICLPRMAFDSSSIALDVVEPLIRVDPLLAEAPASYTDQTPHCMPRVNGQRHREPIRVQSRRTPPRSRLRDRTDHPHRGNRTLWRYEAAPAGPAPLQSCWPAGQTDSPGTSGRQSVASRT